MPAVLLLKLTSDHGLVSEEGHFVAVGYRIDIHTVFGGRYFDSRLRRVSQQASGPDQNKFCGFVDFSAPVLKPVFDLGGIAEFAAGHGLV
jgi:hypothetical protein